MIGVFAPTKPTKAVKATLGNKRKKGNIMKKYELLKDDTKIAFGKTLYRIRYLRDFANIESGDLGGYIEKEDNLSHDGNARVLDNAWVMDNARVFDDALVYGNARVFDNARVYGNARVFDNARVYGDAWVCGDARLKERKGTL